MRETQQLLDKLGRWIAYLRKRKGMSQDQFAEVSGLARSYVAEVERGKLNLSFRNLHRIATALNISLSELMAFETRPANEEWPDE